METKETKETMETTRVENVAETIGNLIISGYRMSKGNAIMYGKYYSMDYIILEKRYAYHDNKNNLHGFDEIIAIDIITKEMVISHKDI